MATLTIRNLPDEVRRALRVRGTEAEVRAILQEAAKAAYGPGGWMYGWNARRPG
jgi:plasmid stability protein